MSNQLILTGVGGGIVGLLIGSMLSGPDLDDFEDRIVAQIESKSAASSEAVTDQLTGLSEKLAALEASVASTAEAGAANSGTMTDQISGAVEALSGKLDTVTESVSASVSQSIADASASQTKQISASLDSKLTELSSAIGSVASSASSTDATEAGTPVPQPPAVEEIDGARPGQTEILLDGKARIFVSSVDEEAGLARVAINGVSMQELGGYKDVIFSADGKECELLLDAIVQGHVQMSATCSE